MIPTLAAALEAQGYDTLTPVQTAVTEEALEGRDLLVSAQTGSGKTVGFGLAIGPSILAEDGTFGPASTPKALIIAPTRELALQVKRELTWLYAKTGAKLASTVGGMDFRDERRTLERGTHIVVATPGRLKDHILRGTINLSEVKAVVLDEADEMLDLGFREDLEFILNEAPEDRRTLMFSATVPKMIEKLAQSYQKNAERVVTQSKTDQHADISYKALQVAQHDADNAIINMLRFYEAPNAIVFANTRAMVTRLTTRLSNRGFSVVALSGELTQSERSNALQAMRDGRARVCVATDVAARGIDLPQLELVIHADLPTNAETLMHRSGRTGRAGRKGVSALIVPPKMRRRAENLLKWGKLDAEWTVPPSATDVQQKDEERLLNDPLWQETPSESETEFAAKLLALHSPELIAAAYLRLYAGKASAPEDLSPPDMKPDRKPREHADFGPTKWFRIDVGRTGKAEARWLLPMICKAGDISKAEIGKITIQENDSYVEIKEDAVPGFMAALGGVMKLENQANLSEVNGTPNFERPPPRGPRKPKHDGPRRPREDGPPKRFDKDRPSKKRDDKPYGDKPYGDKPKFDKPKRDKPHATSAASTDKAKADGALTDYKKRDDAAPKRAKPKYDRGDKPKFDTPRGDKPKSDGPKGDRPYSDKPKGGKPAFKKREDGPKGDRKPYSGGGKPGGGKPKASASDPSKRFTPPGKPAKPRKSNTKGTPKGGGATPTKRAHKPR